MEATKETTTPLSKPSEMAVLKEKNTVLEAEIERLTAENTQLKATGSVRIAKADEGRILVPTDSFTVRGQAYRFRYASFRIKIGGLMTKVLALDALNNDDLLDEIVREYVDLVEVA